MKRFEKVPEIHVGIVRSRYLEFRFHTPYLLPGMVTGIEGRVEAEVIDDLVEVRQEGRVVAAGAGVIFIPLDASRDGFGISDVVIGIGFHWEQKEDQLFPGALKLVLVEGEIQAINLVSIEKYLGCVISSEMRGESSPALLRAHTIISRSWLLAQIEKQGQLVRTGKKYELIHETSQEYIRWYDREDHPGFHVCADDHCQRYQGIARVSNPEVLKAVEATEGQVMVYGGTICDARFSKCCGGVTEAFQNCWEPVPHPYLKRVDDNPAGSGINMEDLKVESNAARFIKGSPEAFCNTRDLDLLRQVLNDYDLASTHFYRWEVSYGKDEIAALIREKSGFDFGEIIDLAPIERGESGRLVRLKIVGTNKTLVVGKELEIRRWLSHTHLYSSAFTVEKLNVKRGVPGGFLLRGAGWGHGVGLCQIGAAVMAHMGYSHERILKHYYIDAVIEKAYE
ncbi:MAG: SpoIID/LytB domain-containing protein [Bacteroidales bacterium]